MRAIRHVLVATAFCVALSGTVVALASDPNPPPTNGKKLDCPNPCEGTINCQDAQIAICEYGACACRAAGQP